MMRLVLKRILTTVTKMHSVTAVNTTTRKQQLFTLGRDIITQIPVGLLAVIHTQEEELIRLA